MHKRVYVGGTFDGIHRGHEALLARSFEAGEQVLIGLTSDAYVKKYKTGVTRPFLERKAAIVQWLHGRGYTGRYAIVPLHDPFGPVVTDNSASALIVSEQTRTRGEEINVSRVRHGLSALDLLVVPMVKAEDSLPISTSRIHKHEIDPEGKFIMPATLRDELTRPLGPVLVDFVVPSALPQLHSRTIITVGDVTTKTLLDAGITPAIMIIDNKVGRQPFDDLRFILNSRRFSTESVISGPGYISRHAIGVIQQLLQGIDVNALKQRSAHVIEVDGEEDLLVLPVIVSAPVGSIVYYGQPGEGVVEVRVTEKKKKSARDLLRRFVVR